MTRSNRQFGQQGEQLAAAYLRERGYVILETNWRCVGGEVDIVARRGETLVFVEVRTRRASTTESAFESVQPRKQARMTTAAYAYLDAHEMDDIPWQIDVIGVALSSTALPVIDHAENALDW